MNDTRRPDPDQLLATVRDEEAKRARGRLKIFFGMSAGVGKTYAMLEEARKRAAEGADVLIGYAEAHIRPDTEALLLGMDLLPYKLVPYRHAVLKEFDLDAALARKPTICCVDELAHTNAPGLRHPKRWQDVVELLDAGVNVYTTLNVQHLESVNDIVERVTGVRVNETLPDSVLEQADEVELVDIAPEELLERFREGRIYRPDQAERAAKHFFTKGNLIALRELALRTTAQRVDAQMLEARREAGARRTWDASERVLVCVGPSPMSPKLVRSARRLAAGLRAEWVAAYVETPRSARISDADRRRLDATLRLADELGGKTITLSGASVADELIAYAQAHNVTKVVIGKPQRPRWRDAVFGSIVDELIRRSGDIDVYVIRGGEIDQQAPGPAGTIPARDRDTIGYLTAFATTAIATAVGWPLFHRFDVANENVLMLYLLAVLWVATHHSRRAAILASVLAVAAFDLMFVEPFYTLAISDGKYVVTFVAMLATALVISTLTHRVRSQADAARQRERRTAALLAMARDLAVARTTEEIAADTVRHVAGALGRRAVVLLADADRRLLTKGDSAAGGGGAERVGEKELGVAQWSYEHGQPAGRGTNTLPAAEGTYLPMRASRGAIGVLGLLGSSDEGIDPEQRQLAEGFASQAALAVERTTLVEEARAAWERVEAEFLRNTLLSGVSHELRTPLAGITGAASALVGSDGALAPGAREELLQTVLTESERMERLITNLLDMTRLESGGLALKREWQPVQDVVGSALRALDRRLQGRDVRTNLPADLPLVHIDSVAMEQVLTNLLDNAVEYTPAGSPIEIAARAAKADVTIEVADRGPGLPVGAERRVFDKFFRAAQGTTRRRGIGLGLAISRGIVEAHGGRITAQSRRDGGGAVFTITLPHTGEPPTAGPLPE